MESVNERVKRIQDQALSKVNLWLIGKFFEMNDMFSLCYMYEDSCMSPLLVNYLQEHHNFDLVTYYNGFITEGERLEKEIEERSRREEEEERAELLAKKEAERQAIADEKIRAERIEQILKEFKLRRPHEEVQLGKLTVAQQFQIVDEVPFTVDFDKLFKDCHSIHGDWFTEYRTYASRQAIRYLMEENGIKDVFKYITPKSVPPPSTVCVEEVVDTSVTVDDVEEEFEEQMDYIDAYKQAQRSEELYARLVEAIKQHEARRKRSADEHVKRKLKRHRYTVDGLVLQQIQAAHLDVAIFTDHQIYVISRTVKAEYELRSFIRKRRTQVINYAENSAKGVSPPPWTPLIHSRE